MQKLYLVKEFIKKLTLHSTKRYHGYSVAFQKDLLKRYRAIPKKLIKQLQCVEIPKEILKKQS